MKQTPLVLCTVATWAASSVFWSAIAQVEPNTRPVLPTPDALLDEPLDAPRLDLPAEQADPDDLDGVEALTIVVDRFEILGSTVFSAEELQAAVAPFVGKPLTLVELLQARTAITQLYVEGGYVSSGAFIPPQEPADGVVIIQVIEGQLVEIDVLGTEDLHPNYVRKRLALAGDAPLQVDRLVDALRLLQLDPLIENISGELAAGLEPGTNRLTVTVEEADSFDVDFVTSNDRSVAIGTWERGLIVNERNLAGWGDGIQLGYLNTDGSNRLLLDYNAPVNARDGNIRLHFEYTDSEVVNEPLDELDINSTGFLLDLTFRQPIYRTPTEEFALSLTGSWNRNRGEFLEDLLGEAFPFPSLGANEDGVVEYYTLRFAQDWTKRNRTNVIALRSQFNFGLGGSDPVETVPNVPDGNFFSWFGQAQWVQSLGSSGTLVLVRGESQLAAGSLPTQELYSLGGQRTIRGYRQDRLLTDNAILASAEVRVPIARYRQRQGLVQLVPFFDIGTGWNADLPDPDPDTLIGIGVGLLWTDGDRLSVRLDWGIPLNDDESGDSLQEDGIYFLVNFKAF